MNNDQTTHYDVISSFEELEKRVSKLKEFGRQDQQNILNLLLSEYNALKKYIKKNPIPLVYQQKELRTLQIKIANSISEMDNLLNCYNKVDSCERKLNESFDIYFKQTLAYKQLEEYMDVMRMYLNFDQIGHFKRILRRFQEQKAELKALPNERSQYIVHRLQHLSHLCGKLSTGEQAVEFQNKIDQLLKLSSKELVDQQRNIIALQAEIFKSIAREYQNHIRRNLISGVSRRLLDRVDTLDYDINEFKLELQTLKKRVIADSE